VNDTTDVRFWDVRRNRSSRSTSYEVRWVVGGRQFSKTRATKALADSFLSELRQAAKRGEAFDTGEGLPVSMRRAKHATSWFAFVLAYVDVKWPRAAAKTRDSMTDALATPEVTTRAQVANGARCWRRAPQPPPDGAANPRPTAGIRIASGRRAVRCAAYQDERAGQR